MHPRLLSLLLFAGACTSNTDKNAQGNEVGDGIIVIDTDEDFDTDAECTPSPEVCDGVDNDCDGEVDEDPTDGDTYFLDNDNDTYGDETTAVVACAAPEGYTSTSGDCDDGAPGINPAAVEVCDDLDNDCNDAIDDAPTDGNLYYADNDADTYGDPSASLVACSQPQAYVENAEDCDDTQSTVYPGAMEICDSLDNDCNTEVDDSPSDGILFFEDADADGFGNALSTAFACEPPTGFVADSTDCDDLLDSVNPQAPEICDDVDNDCNNTIDDSPTDGTTFYEDADGDLYGNPNSTVSECQAPEGYLSDATDCDDLLSNVYPGAPELCDTLDNDCNNTIDDAPVDGTTFYEDADGDLFGNPNSTVSECEAPAGYLLDATDCDDLLPTVNPSAPEICDSLDNDCNLSIDDSPVDGTTFYLDSDGDLFGDPEVSVSECEAPTGYLLDATDCDDLLPTVNPSAPEICDDLDNDCNDLIDDEPTDGFLFYPDLDGDGRGAGDALLRCEAPDGYVLSDDDCDDTRETVYPGAIEACDGVSSDCNGSSWSTDAGLMTFVSDAGEITDWTAEAEQGEDEDVVTLTPADGGEMFVCPGTWFVNFVPTSDLTLTGVGTRDTIILNGGTDESVAQVQTSDVSLTVSNLTIRDGTAEESALTSPNDYELGGAIHCTGAGTITVTNVVFEDNNSSRWGGAIGVDECDLVVSDSTFDNNDGDHGGGAIFVQAGVASITTSIFTNNYSDDHDGGGGILAADGAIVTVADSTLSGNESEKGGALAATRTGPDGAVLPVLTGQNLIINDNTGNAAAAIYIENGSLLLISSEVSDHNRTALRSKDGTVSIVAGSFLNNTTNGDGGAIRLEHSTLNISATLFADNESNDQGGAIYGKHDDSSITLLDAIFTDNEAEDEGGAIYFKDGLFTALNTTFSDNFAEESGGAIYLKDADVSITDSDFFNNTSDDEGGALTWEDSVGSLIGVSFIGNDADDDGGAIWFEDDLLTLSECLFNNNGPDDIYNEPDGASYNYSGPMSATCDDNGC